MKMKVKNIKYLSNEMLLDELKRNIMARYLETKKAEFESAEKSYILEESCRREILLRMSKRMSKLTPH